MLVRNALAALAAFVLTGPMTGCYVHGRGAVVVRPGYRHHHGYVVPAHYGYYRPAPVVVVAPGPGPVAAPPRDAPVATAPVAVAAPAGVDVRPCGGAGGATVHATFATTGRAIDVRVVAASGALDEATTRCLRERFAGVSIPAFTGAPRTLSWPVDLGAPTAVAPIPAAAPVPAPAAPPIEGDEVEPEEGEDHAPHSAPPAPPAAPSGAWL